MEVQVRYCLPPGCLVRLEDGEPVRMEGAVDCLRNPRRRTHERGGGVGVGLENRLVGSLRCHDDVTGIHLASIHECEDMFVLVHLRTRQFPSNDPRENGFRHVDTPFTLEKLLPRPVNASGKCGGHIVTTDRRSKAIPIEVFRWYLAGMEQRKIFPAHLIRRIAAIPASG